MNTSIQVSNPSFLSRYNYQVESDPMLTVTRAIIASISFLRNNESTQLEGKSQCYKTTISLNQDTDCKDIIIEDNGIGIENPHTLWQSIKNGLQNDSMFGEDFSCFNKICDKITIISKVDIADEYFKLDINLNRLNDDSCNSHKLSWIRTIYDSQRADFSMLSYTKIILSGIPRAYQFKNIECIKPYVENTNYYKNLTGRDMKLIFANMKSHPIKFIKDLNGDVFEKVRILIFFQNSILQPCDFRSFGMVLGN